LNPSTVAQREAVQAALSGALREVYGTGACLVGWDAAPLSQRGRHRVVRYDLQARVAGLPDVQHYQCVGKFYERDEEARRVAIALRALGAATGRAGHGVITPRVLAHCAPLRLLLLTYEPGQSVIAAIGQNGGVVLPAMGRALAALHALPVATGAISSPAALTGDVQRRVDDLCARFPGEAPALRHTLSDLLRRVPAAPAAPSFLHGDLGPAQLRWRSGDVVFLDFDACTRGDRAFDLGNLLTQLRRLTLRKPGKLPPFAGVRRDLLDAYQRSSPDDPGLVHRIAWYERAVLVRKIHCLAFDTTRHTAADAIRQRQQEAISLLREFEPVVRHAVSEVPRIHGT